MSSIDTIDDDRLEAEREDGRTVATATLIGTSIGVVVGAALAIGSLRESLSSPEAVITFALIGFSTAVAALLASLVYRYSEDWLLERAVERGYIDTEDPA